MASTAVAHAFFTDVTCSPTSSPNTNARGSARPSSRRGNYTFHVAAGGTFPLQEIYTANLRGQSHGAGPNVIMKTRYHLTINGPGQVTVARDLFTIECIPD